MTGSGESPMYAPGLTQEQDIELAAVRFVCELFSRNRHLSEGPIGREADPELLERIAARGIPAQGRPLDDVVREMQDDIIGYGYNIDHARFLGFVPGPVTAVSWLGDMMASGYNRHAGSFANYPAGCVAEHAAMLAGSPTIPPDGSRSSSCCAGSAIRAVSPRGRAACSCRAGPWPT